MILGPILQQLREAGPKEAWIADLTIEFAARDDLSQSDQDLLNFLALRVLPKSSAAQAFRELATAQKRDIVLLYDDLDDCVDSGGHTIALALVTDIVVGRIGSLAEARYELRKRRARAAVENHEFRRLALNPDIAASLGRQSLQRPAEARRTYSYELRHRVAFSERAVFGAYYVAETYSLAELDELCRRMQGPLYTICHNAYLLLADSEDLPRKPDDLLEASA